jgi:hypothetical protein
MKMLTPIRSEISFAQLVADDYQKETGVTAEALAMTHVQIARKRL